jgi:hypothetical protein
VGARVTFPAARDAAFIAAVRRDVAEYFAASNGTDKANGSMVVKTAFLLASTITAYALLLSNCLGPWAMHTFDARNNMPRMARVLIARGRDAVDVPIANTFGPAHLSKFEVTSVEAPIPI